MLEDFRLTGIDAGTLLTEVTLAARTGRAPGGLRAVFVGPDRLVLVLGVSAGLAFGEILKYREIKIIETTK